MLGGPALPAGVTLAGELGRGAHGVVYQVRRGGRDWAMKVFTEPVDADGVALVALRREAALLAWVGHGGLPQVHEVGQAGDRAYLIMDLVRGVSLSAVLAGGPAAIGQVAEWGVQVGETLAAVHAVGLVHRDVKPDNIMIEPDGRVRLIDFGTAAQVGAEQADLVVGTLRYSAPEQSGMIKRPVDARSDLYALGVVLFEALAGRPPFVSDNVAELLRMHVTTPAPRLGTLRPDVPGRLAEVVARLLAKDPDDRYQTSASLVADLRASVDTSVSGAGPAAGAADQNGADQNGADQNGADQYADPDAADQVGLAPLVGRDPELARLAERWRQAQGGAGGVAVVSGGPGSGTTRLLQELAAGVRRHGVPVLWAACDGDAGPLSALRAAVEHHLSRLRRLPPPVRDTALGQVRHAAGAAATLLRRLSPALADVLSGGAPAPSDAPEAAPEAAGVVDPDALTRAAAAFLAELARVSGGALVCLDDALRADQASQAVLRLVAAELTDVPLLVVLSTHQPVDAPVAERVEAVVGPADCVVTLAELSAESVFSLVAAVARGLAVDPEVTGRLAAGCGASPFEVQEYVRAVVDAGLLVPHWGTVRLDLPGLDALVLPDDVFSLVLRRVDGLGPRCRHLLTVCAAIGLRFDGELAARASDVDDPDEAMDLLDRAAAATVVEHRDGALRFVHDGVRRVLLDAWDEPARRRLHQRIADALHDVDSTDPAHIYALGRHCLHGDADRTPARAFPALLAAGRQALATGAPAEAVPLLHRAGQLADRVPAADRGELDELLGTAQYRAGQLTAALGTLGRALSVRTDPVDRARILVHIYEVHLGAGDVDATRTTTLQALAELGRRLPTHPLMLIVSSLRWFGAGLLVERLGLHTGNAARHARYELEATLLINLASIHLLALDPLGSLALSLRTLYPASRLTPCPAYVRTRAELGAIARVLGLPSNTAYRRAERAAAMIGDPEAVELVAWMRRTIDVTTTGDLRTLTTQMTDRTGLIPSNLYVIMAVHAIWQLLGAGYTRQAGALRDQAVARLAPAELAEHELTLCDIALASALGRITEADAMLRRIEDQPPARRSPNRRLLTLLAQATAAVEQQDVGATLDRVAADLATMRVNPRTLLPSHLTIYPVLAYGRLDQCRRAGPAHHKAALAAAAGAVTLLGKAPGPITRAHHRVATAYLRHLRGDHRGALDALADDGHRSGDVPAPSISFETARLRARVLTALDRPADATAAAAGALTLAELNGWPHRAQWIRTEFPDLRPSGPYLSGGTDRLNHSASQTTHRQLLAALEQMTNAASGILDPGQLTRVALDEIIRLLSAERAFMFLVAADGHLVPHLGRDMAGNDLTQLTDYGSTLVERVRQTSEPLVVTGTDEGAALGSHSVVAHGLRSIMVAPLRFTGQLLGVVYLDSRIAKGMFTASDIGLLAALTTHIGAALETARAAQLAVSAESIRRERDLAVTLRAAMVDLSATLDPADVLRRLHATAARILSADRSWLAIVDSEKILVYAGTDAEDPTQPPPTADIDPALHRLIAAVEPLLGDPGTTPPSAFAPAGRNWMAVPLRLADSAVGVIVLASDQLAGFGPAQVDIAGVLADHGMIAYHNARLFAQTEQMATTDALTGLSNRRHFFTNARLGIALASRQRSPLAAAMIDIDHFKQVNDVHGHQVGDQVISAVGRRLAHTVRATDVLGRYGGEEFAVILLDTSRDGAGILAERLRVAVADRPVDTDAGPLNVTVSIGVALLPDHTDVETLLADADAALYQAKNAGRNRVVLRGPGPPLAGR
jgi:eukaryotic-like serine/threonine-protein kinase